jgi:hypothetical protein
MYLLQRLAGLPDRGKDEVGGDISKGPNGLAYGFSMVQGRRPYMEDVVYASLNFGSDGSNSFFGVFDGHSGKRAALWAKEHLPKNLTSELDASRGVQEALTRAFLRTDGDFLDKAGREGLTDGCTVSTALLCGMELYVANAGDRFPPLPLPSSFFPSSPPAHLTFHSAAAAAAAAAVVVVVVAAAQPNNSLPRDDGDPHVHRPQAGPAVGAQAHHPGGRIPV